MKTYENLGILWVFPENRQLRSVTPGLPTRSHGVLTPPNGDINGWSFCIQQGPGWLWKGLKKPAICDEFFLGHFGSASHVETTCLGSFWWKIHRTPGGTPWHAAPVTALRLCDRSPRGERTSCDTVEGIIDGKKNAHHVYICVCVFIYT